MRRQGITEKFWEFLFTVLGQWKAFRPKPKEQIWQEGRNNLNKITDCYNGLSKLGDPNILSIESLGWNDVFPFFDLAYSLKAVGPPTFGSKLCHFIFPSAFFIWDNKLVKAEPAWKESYQTYWEDLKVEWLKATDKESLRQELRKHIPREPCVSYPWATKISELCQYPD